MAGWAGGCCTGHGRFMAGAAPFLKERRFLWALWGEIGKIKF